jgi:hypothetical protein
MIIQSRLCTVYVNLFHFFAVEDILQRLAAVGRTPLNKFVLYRTAI